MKVFKKVFAEMISAERLFAAWFLFRKGKRSRKDVQLFERHLEQNVFKLHRELRVKKYQHDPYHSFFIHDPKIRHIRKACVRDRLVHQSIYTTLTEIFEPKLIHHLYSCRLGKGTHKAVNELKKMTWKVSQNHTRPCWGLKCDVRKFYDTVDHEILKQLISEVVLDEEARWLINTIIDSYHFEGTPGKGMPIGNLTSQIFTNIYLNAFDQYAKKALKVGFYLRFADDMLFLSEDKSFLENLIPHIESFLGSQLKLRLHPKKIILRPLTQGIDFLGYVTLPYHRVLRTKTERRMKRKLNEKLNLYFDGELDSDSYRQTMNSYLGILSHADAFQLQQKVKMNFAGVRKTLRKKVQVA